MSVITGVDRSSLFFALEINSTTICQPGTSMHRNRGEHTAALLGLSIPDLVGNGNEETVVGEAFGVHADGGGDVGLDLDVLARVGRDGEVNSGVRESSIALGSVEVLDQRGEGVKLRRRRIPISSHQQPGTSIKRSLGDQDYQPTSTSLGFAFK
jgi:hypothetical protein